MAGTSHDSDNSSPVTPLLGSIVSHLASPRQTDRQTDRHHQTIGHVESLLANIKAGLKTKPNPHRTRDANWNVFPLMLLACSVDTPIHINRFHFLCIASRVLCGLGLRAPAYTPFARLEEIVPSHWRIAAHSPSPGPPFRTAALAQKMQT